MRLIARMSDKRQVGFLVDTLRKGGFDRKDMIISHLGDTDERLLKDPEEVADEISFIKTERDGLWETGSFAQGIKELKGKTGILVAVNTPKLDADRVRAMMEQSGAADIIQD
ncbi:hypothetical protein DCCM_0221 [Desulfocucumis palustris]|uniref:Uncharacterized protein n=1 Tax=Desulfocucumis palustris TaxID=1898651 RepID=A0A2L2X7Q0_9FIRM|nr:hypothetical protein [Desulfocucumis palustris]GBF32030.1 hypothetical protein DCCM_0221 [Desulfocucumis palustris]